VPDWLHALLRHDAIVVIGLTVSLSEIIVRRQNEANLKGGGMSRNLWKSAACLAAGLGVYCVADARPPADHPVDPEMHQWYESLRQPGKGAGCCSIADCRPYESRLQKDHYEIFIHDRWFPVPNSVVLHVENRAGLAVACLGTQWNYDLRPAPAEYAPNILCFVPGPEV
jgi:hypothetical protein